MRHGPDGSRMNTTKPPPLRVGAFILDDDSQPRHGFILDDDSQPAHDRYQADSAIERLDRACIWLTGALLLLSIVEVYLLNSQPCQGPQVGQVVVHCILASTAFFAIAAQYSKMDSRHNRGRNTNQYKLLPSELLIGLCSGVGGVLTIVLAAVQACSPPMDTLAVVTGVLWILWTIAYAAITYSLRGTDDWPWTIAACLGLTQ